jgi:hypothetical protein
MAGAHRFGMLTLLALTPSACTLLDGLNGLEGTGRDDAGGDVAATDAPSEASDTGNPTPESGADAAGDGTGGMQPESSTMDVVRDVVSADGAETGTVAYFTEVAMDSPQAYWRLDEPTGSTTAHDASGNGHDGAYMGGITLGAAGAIANDQDKAASFDGATGYVDVPSAFAFAGKVAFSLEAWVKPAMITDGFHAWMSKNDSSGPPSEGYLAYMDPSGGIFTFQRVDSGTKITTTGNMDATVGTWAHVVVTYDPMAGTIVYVDGQAGPTQTNDVSLAGAMADFTIGAQNAGATAWWNGVIDEVAVYDYALSAARILVHYDVGTGKAP